MTIKSYRELFGRSDFTENADVYTSSFFVGSYKAKGGNDIFSTPETGATFLLSKMSGGLGNDRLKLQGDTTLIGKNVYDGGDGVDTFEIASSSRAINMSIDGTITFDSGRCHPTGYLETRNVERYIIQGSDFSDTLRGYAGNDFLDGNGGLDKFFGSAGDDGYVFDDEREFVSGEQANGGTDSIFTTVSHDLNRSAFVENLRLFGDAAINGTGNALNNIITGNDANNVIKGGLGVDTLYGRGGSDTFSFSEAGQGNADVIWDFDATDFIKLDARVFTGLATANGVLDASAFTTTGPDDASAHIIYSRETGMLSYDADGNGAGSAVDIAFIGRYSQVIQSSDFLVA